MPAPSLNLTRGSITYTADPILKDGYEIVSSMTSAAEGADWRLSVSLRIDDSSVVDQEDRAASFSLSNVVVPFNEAPSFAAAVAKLQSLVDMVYDQFVPAPAPAPVP